VPSIDSVAPVTATLSVPVASTAKPGITVSPSFGDVHVSVGAT